MKARVAIFGKGNVGGALRRGLERAGYEVKAVGRGGPLRETAAWAEVVILAVPYGQLPAAVAAAGDALDGKAVVDVSNVVGKDLQPLLGFSTSGAEELQAKAPRAKVVKAFNTVFAQHMDSGRLGERPLAALAAGDDEEAKGRSCGSPPTSASTRWTPGRCATPACSSPWAP